MASVISAGTTSGTALNMTADTSGQLQFATGASATTAVTIDSSQNVTLNNVIPSSSTAPTNGMFLPTTNTVGLSTASTERMRIDSNGNLFVGTTTIPATGAGTNSTIVSNKDYSGAFAQIINSSSTTGTQFFIEFGRGASECGKITSTATNSTTYATSSDYRLKENIAPMIGALDKIALLKPVTYTWKIDGSEGQGFIAHELQEVMPDAVVGEKDELNEDGSIRAQAIDTSFLVATLTAAIQELTERVKALESK